MTSRVRASILAITFAAILALPSIAAAQSPVTVGVKAGVNFATLSVDEDDDSDVKGLVGAVGGLFVSKSINEKLGWRLEGLFSQKGAKDAEAGDDFKFKLTYIDVPFLLTLGPAGSNFNFFTGPQVSFNTKAEFTDGTDTLDVKDDVKSTDFGWVIGAGLASGRFSADARYTLGLSNIFSNANDGSAKNRVFSVMVGVKLK